MQKAAWHLGECQSISRPFYGVCSYCFMQTCHIVGQVHTSLSSFRLSPAILITSCMPLSFSFSNLPIYSLELRFKRKLSAVLRAGWSDFSEDLAGRLCWFQLRKYILPKINSFLSLALQLEATKQMAMKPRAASTEHLETAQKGAGPGAPKGKVSGGRECVHAHTQTHKLHTRKADQQVYAASLVSHTCNRQQLERWYSVEVKGEASEARLFGALS